MGVWREVGDGVFVRRYPFFDSNVGAILGDDGVLIVDTRTSHAQADEIRRELAQITSRPVVRVVNTHMHSDHTFGNGGFGEAQIWGHERCAAALREGGEAARASLIAQFPEKEAEFREVAIVPPDHTFTERASVAWGGRTVELLYLGRGHTDNDVIVVVPERRPGGGSSDGSAARSSDGSAAGSVLFVGDLLENGAPPWFGDGYPLEWPATVEAILPLVGGVIVPGHGAVGDRSFAVGQAEEIAAVARLAREVHAGELALEEAVASGPFPPATMEEALGQALGQLRGELV